jgi:hypothetical protein
MTKVKQNWIQATPLVYWGFFFVADIEHALDANAGFLEGSHCLCIDIAALSTLELRNNAF